MEKITAHNFTPPRLETQRRVNNDLSVQFSKFLGEALDGVNQLQVKADTGIQKLQSGQDTTLPEVMIDMSQADLSMRLLVQMRNKVVEAYQEIMRMQV